MREACWCIDCDCLLFSDYSRAKGVCPECETPDQEAKDLEDQFKEAIDPIENFN